jgi:hypothetical protein
MSELLEKYRYAQVEDSEWYESTKEGFHKALELIGFYDVQSYFTGFSSQGDGACFTGRYSYERGGLKALKAEFPKWDAMHELAKELQDLQRRCFYGLMCNIETSGRYCHSNTMHIYLPCETTEFMYSLEDEILSIFRRIADLYYVSLESQFDYLTSDESVKEWIELNEIIFN